MKDRKDWIQLLLSIVLPLFFSGGLVLFREYLPKLLYTTLLWVLCLFIISVLVRLAFSDLVHKLYVWTRNYLQNRSRRRARQKMVKEWHLRWLDLAQLIITAMENGWQPTKDQENNYSKLRSWFRKNRSEFLPIWHNFRSARTRTAHEHSYNYYGTLAEEVFSDNYGDPFSYFYEPLMIEDFSKILEYKGENEVSRVLVKLSELVGELSEWIRRWK